MKRGWVDRRKAELPDGDESSNLQPSVPQTPENLILIIGDKSIKVIDTNFDKKLPVIEVGLDIMKYASIRNLEVEVKSFLDNPFDWWEKHPQ